MVAERDFAQALPVIHIAIGLLGGWGSFVGLCGLCCMALSASDVYHLTGETLRQACLEQDLDTSGPVRLLRMRLVEHLRSGRLEEFGRVKMAQASAMTDLKHEVGNTASGGDTLGSHVDNPIPALVELLLSRGYLSG